MIDEHEGLNPGPEPLSPTHKRSAKSTQLPALVFVDFSIACCCNNCSLGASGLAPRPPRPAAPRASAPQAQPSGSASQPLGDGELSGEQCYVLR